MNTTRFLGRLLLAPVFLFGGWDTLQHPAKRVDVAKSAGAPLADTAVRVNASLMVAAGALLLLGILPRLAALLLAGSMVPTTLFGHQFWKKEGPERKSQLTQFTKNMAAAGGLLLFSVQPSTECKVIVEE